MGTVGLKDIITVPLRRIAVTGGDVMHAMKKGDPGYNEFGEAYFSWAKKGHVKAWKRHTEMTMNLVVPLGEIRFVFVSPQNPEEFRVEDIGASNYTRITVPPGIWFGFTGISEQDSLLMNIANIIHAPDESLKKTVSSFSFNWLIHNCK